MIGIIVIGHGNFAKGLVESSEIIVGKQQYIETIGLNPGDSIDHFKEILIKKIEKLDSNEGLLIMCDLFGGSPCNVATSLMNSYSFECITGVNMPMLLEVLVERKKDNNLETLSQKALQRGGEGIRNTSLLLKVGSE